MPWNSSNSDGPDWPPHKWQGSLSMFEAMLLGLAGFALLLGIGNVWDLRGLKSATANVEDVRPVCVLSKRKWYLIAADTLRMDCDDTAGIEAQVAKGWSAASQRRAELDISFYDPACGSVRMTILPWQSEVEGVTPSSKVQVSYPATAPYSAELANTSEPNHGWIFFAVALLAPLLLVLRRWWRGRHPNSIS